MVVLNQETRYAKANDNAFTRFSLQIEQGLPVLSRWLVFNQFKFVGTKGIRLGPSFLLTSVTGGSIVDDMAPHQGFAIGGVSSVRGYGEGAVGTGRSCLVANSELTFPLSKMMDGAIFMDYGSDMGSGRLVTGNPALRQGKPRTGIGFGYGLHFKSQIGHFQVDYAINGYQQKIVYFSISNVPSYAKTGSCIFLILIKALLSVLYVQVLTHLKTTTFIILCRPGTTHNARTSVSNYC